MTIDTLLKSVCTPNQRALLQRYAACLQTENQTVNLVSRKDIQQVLGHHIVPSLLYALLGRIQPGELIVDIGCGGGLPGIVNAILFPETRFVLVDSTKKKIMAIDRMITALGLPNVTARWSRIEDLAGDIELTGTVHRTTSRAVAPLTDLIRWSQPLLTAGGTIEALKGGDVSAEIAAAQKKFPDHVFTPLPCPQNYRGIDRLSQLTLIVVSSQQ